MIKATFLLKQGKLYGFKIEGHANAGVIGSDIVCAAVSSAAYLTINTITDVLNISANAYAENGKIGIIIKQEDYNDCKDILKGFELHMNELKKQYPKNIKVIYGGCKNA